MIILCIVFSIISGACVAVCDTLQFHYYDSIFTRFKEQFWNPTISWRNKYKDHDAPTPKIPRFFGSTTIFVSLTDAWHLFKSLAKISLFISLYFLLLSDSKNLIIVFILLYWSSSISFQLFFYLYKKI